MQRRTLLGSALALASVSGASLGGRHALAAGGQLTVVSFGGAYQDAQSKALFQPAAKALGITVKEETYTGIADLRLKVKAGAVTWDVVTSGSGSAAHAGDEGILEKLDYKVIDVSSFLPGTFEPYYIGGDMYSTVLAWNTKTYPTNPPQDWADFWDVKKFPGKRSYRNAVAGSLEPALMAEGVPLDQIYKVLSAPGGIARAIKKVAELKPHVAVWWSSGAQHAQLMKDGEVDMVNGWNGRFDAVAKDGGNVAYTYNQGMLDYDAYCVPKGAPNRALAMKFLAEISKPKYQAELTKYITYGPTNRKAYEIGAIDKAYEAKLPSSPANAAKQLSVTTESTAWYAKHEAEASQAYQNMLTA